MSKEHSSSIIEELHQHELDTLEAEAKAGGTELEPTLSVLQREQRRRRGLLLAATEMDATGVWTGSPEDTPDAIPRTDSRWLHAPVKSVE